MKKFTSLQAVAAASTAAIAALCAACSYSEIPVEVLPENTPITMPISDYETASNALESNNSLAYNENSAENVSSVSSADIALFDTYVSNTFIATGNNYLVESAENVTYRAYLPAEEYGSLEYCFYFSNNVDSTYDNGAVAHVGIVGGDYTISSAYIADGGTAVGDEITNKTAVTFDNGSTTKNVGGGEDYWSDPVNFELADGHYLVWEWTLTGSTIPCTNMSSLTQTDADYGDGKGFVYCDQIPLPQLIGAKRDVIYNIAAIGDSITQGCQTQFMEYEFWAAKIPKRLGSDYSFWNCGLGWSRTSDAATCGNWLERTKTADVVIIAFGTNDITSGEYGAGEANTAAEVNQYVRILLDEFAKTDCKVIVFNAPPENYNKKKELVRVEYNKILKNTCSEYGVMYFDFAGYLSDPEQPDIALYGAHPDGEGGDIISEKFVEEFAAMLKVEN